MKISIVIPVYNEEDNLTLLFQQVDAVLLSIPSYEYEMIMINDGSTDGTSHVLRKRAQNDRRVKVISFQNNQGQTAALQAGIDNAEGDVIVTIDGDLENDPADIPKLLAKLDEGFDVVSGYREHRWRHQLFIRRLPSSLANSLISWITGLKLHDYGCTLKAYRKHLIENTGLYGEMHRFIPAFAFWRGARIAEVIVNFRPRLHGKSHYGVSRTYKVILDLILLKFLDKYMNRPMHFFGGIGIVSFILGFFTGLLSLVLKLLGMRDFVETPLPVYFAFLTLVGVQMLAMGIIAEILMRTYYESQRKKSYRISEKINLG